METTKNNMMNVPEEAHDTARICREKVDRRDASIRYALEQDLSASEIVEVVRIMKDLTEEIRVLYEKLTGDIPGSIKDYIDTPGAPRENLLNGFRAMTDVTSCVNLVMVSQKWAVEKYRELQEKYPEYLEYTEEE
jgi:hypothetical protein